MPLHRLVMCNLQKILEWFFCCWHRNMSRPFTISGRTYEVCLDCGKQIPYAQVDLGGVQRAAALGVCPSIQREQLNLC